MYDYVMANLTRIGSKYFATIPTQLIKADMRFQRVGNCSNSKIAKLAENFDETLMDVLRVSPHDDEKKFSVIDGYHRLSAAQRNHVKFVPCEVIMGLPKEPELRLRREAEIFAMQDAHREKLSPQQIHKSAVLLGRSGNVALEKAVKKYGISFKPVGVKNVNKPNVLTGFNAALRTASSDPELLDTIFSIIRDSGWNEKNGGYGDRVICAIKGTLMGYRKQQCVYDALADFMKQITPQEFEVRAVRNYPYEKKAQARIKVLKDALSARGIVGKYSGK